MDCGRSGSVPVSGVNKHELLDQIIAHLSAEIEAYEKSARSAHAEATHEQNKAENKYDTRALEASYLAHGQSKQAADAHVALQQFQALASRAFGSGNLVDLGALVELTAHEDHSFYFIGPRAGGIEITQDGNTVLVLTPQSPLGRQLMGKRKGDRVKIEQSGIKKEYLISAVS